MSPWTIGLVTAMAAMLLRSGFRRHGWARFIFIVLAIAVLLVTVWYAMVKAGEQAESRENAAIGKIFPSGSASPPSAPGLVRWHGRVTISSR